MANFYIWKMIGVAGVASYATARILSNANIIGYNRYKLVAVPVEAMPKMPKGYSVRELSAEGLAAFTIDASAETQTLRFASGLHCLATFNTKQELVAISWVSAKDYLEDEVHVRYVLPEKGCWDTGLWVSPEQRGGRAFAATWAGIANWMRERGLQWSLSRITDYNHASIQSHKRMSAKILGHFFAIKIGRWQFAPAARPRLVRIDPKNPPAITIRPLVPH